MSQWVSSGRSPALRAWPAAALLLLAATSASASPWVLSEGRGVIGLTAGVSLADSEYLPDGTHQDFPLEGQFEGYYLQLAGRYGVLPNFEISASLMFKGVSYQSDPLLNPPADGIPSDPDAALRAFREQNLDFSQRAVGLGDIYVGAAYQHLRSPFRLASVAQVKIPTGYRSPRQTFLRDDPQTGQVADDVTLGDGQVDLEYGFQAGLFIPASRTLLELDAAYRARFNGPGHQAVGLFKLGQFIGSRLLLIAQVNGAFTLFEGEVLGRTFIARDPSVSALDFTSDNVTTSDYRLDRDFVSVSGGALLRAGGNEWVLRVEHVVWGENYSRLTTISLGVLSDFRLGKAGK